MKILIVEDEKYMRNVLKQLLETEKYHVDTAENGMQALELVKKNNFDLIITDLKMPEMDGLTLIKNIRKRNLTLPIIVLTAFGTMEDAVECMKIGANDFLPKPFKVEELLKSIKKLLEINRSNSVKLKESNLNLIGEAPSFKSALDLALRIAKEDVPVILLGETGVGKEEFAKFIHINSNRNSKNFVSINCGAIPHELIESELFGYKKGAFTGAYSDKKGIFESADGGTVFLDEIGDLPLSAQVKLLRFLENSTFLPIGEVKEKKVNVRLIFATNKDLKKEVMEKRFREDLYYRINIFPIYIPPLRERKEDILPLIKNFVQNSSKKEIKISNEFVDILKKYKWPGNIRELKHFIERVIFLDTDNFLDSNDIPKDFYNNVISTDIVKNITIDNFHRLKEKVIKNFEYNYFSTLMDETGWNINKAARLSGLSRKTIYQKLDELGIKREN